MLIPDEPCGRGVDALEQLAYLIAEAMAAELDDQLADAILTKENFALLCKYAPYEGAKVRGAGGGC